MYQCVSKSGQNIPFILDQIYFSTIASNGENGISVAIRRARSNNDEATQLRHGSSVMDNFANWPRRAGWLSYPLRKSAFCLF